MTCPAGELPGEKNRGKTARAYRQDKEEEKMKVKASVKPICEKCKIIKRHGKVMVICENPKHKQRQG